MPPKKSGSSGAEADDSVEKLYRALRRGLQEFNMSIPPKLEEKFSEIRDEKNPGKLTDLVIYDPVGPIGARVIMQSLRQTRYDQTRVIRFWKA